jgi:hypothetical protein
MKYGKITIYQKIVLFTNIYTIRLNIPLLIIIFSHIDKLEGILPMIRIHKNDTVYTQLNHVSRSGMSRKISIFVIRNNKPIDISYLAEEKLGWTVKSDGVHVSGCGMDMGFHLVYSLAQVLFKDGYALNQKWL